MPVDALSASGARPQEYQGFSVGANAKAAQEAKEAKAATKLTEAQKEQLFLEKMNKGQKLDREPVTPENQGKLGKDDFMKLLIATLKYQDPSSPMDTQKLLEQTSVMTNMEQMIKMTEASQKAFEAQKHAQGSTLVGKTVVYDAVDAEGNAVTTAGKVDAVEFLAKGEVLVHVGKAKLKMDEILGVADPTEDPVAPVDPKKAADKTKGTEKAKGTPGAKTDGNEVVTAAEMAAKAGLILPTTGTLETTTPATEGSGADSADADRAATGRVQGGDQTATPVRSSEDTASLITQTLTGAAAASANMRRA